MNKELTPLEALHKIADVEMKEQYKASKNCLVYRVISDEHSKELNIIEKSLKEKEILQMNYTVLESLYKDLLLENGALKKIFKALEVIKEMLDQYGGLDFEEVDTGVYVGTRTEPQYGRNYFISKEKARLLKEVLL